MKTHSITKAFACCLFAMAFLPCNSLFAGPTKKKDIKTVHDTATRCLELSGIVTDNNSLDNARYMIRLFNDNKPVDTLVISANSTFKFILKRNAHYTVKISRQGFIGRSVSIDTQMPNGININPMFRFHFETELIKESDFSQKDHDLLDFPIALVSYNAKKGWFTYSRKYTSIIKKDVGYDKIYTAKEK